MHIVRSGLWAAGALLGGWSVEVPAHMWTPVRWCAVMVCWCCCAVCLPGQFHAGAYMCVCVCMCVCAPVSFFLSLSPCMSTSLPGDGDCVERHPDTFVITTALLRGCCIGQSCRAAPCTFWVLLPKARHGTLWIRVAVSTGWELVHPTSEAAQRYGCVRP